MLHTTFFIINVRNVPLTAIGFQLFLSTRITKTFKITMGVRGECNVLLEVGISTVRDMIFLLSGNKVCSIPPCEAKNPFFDPLVGGKPCTTRK